MLKTLAAGVLVSFILTTVKPLPVYAFSMGDNSIQTPTPENAPQPVIAAPTAPQPQPAAAPPPVPVPGPVPAPVPNDNPNGYFSDTLSPPTPPPAEGGNEAVTTPVPPAAADPLSLEEVKQELLKLDNGDILGKKISITYINDKGEKVTVTGTVGDNLIMYTDDTMMTQTNNIEEAGAFQIAFEPEAGQQGPIFFNIDSDSQIISITELDGAQGGNGNPNPIPGTIGIFGWGNPPKPPDPVPLQATLLIGNGYNMTEGDAFFLQNLSGYFHGTNASQAIITVTGLPPGLTYQDGAIIGQLAQGSAGTYNINIIATAPDGEMAQTILEFNVAAPSGFVNALTHYAMGQFYHSNNVLNLANQQIGQNFPTDIMNSFQLNFASISALGYVPNDFNCDSISTALMLATQASGYYVYEFYWAIVNPSGEVVEHEINLVWLGRIGEYDVYGTYEPQKGSFVTTFIMPASDEDPTAIPLYALHQYIQASGYSQPGYQLHPVFTQYISAVPIIHDGNMNHFNPLVWQMITGYYLTPELAQTIMAGLPNIQLGRPKPPVPPGVDKPSPLPIPILNQEGGPMVDGNGNVIYSPETTGGASKPSPAPIPILNQDGSVMVDANGATIYAQTTPAGAAKPPLPPDQGNP